MKNKALIFLVVLVVFPGCGGTEESLLQDLAEDALDERSLAELSPLEVSFPEVADVATDETGWDIFEVELDIMWEPAPGEPGYPCATGLDCDEGFCIQTAEGRVCTPTCIEECPFDWECALHVPSLPDQVYICVPPFVELCRPCQANADCHPHGADGGQACVSYGPAGYYCGAPCDVKEDCPAGYDCAAAMSISGGSATYCQAATGQCECAPWFVNAGANTSCYVENEFGICEGNRKCLDEGLQECSAVTPTPETCNNADDDCDGEVDEDTGGEPCLVSSEWGQCDGTETCDGGELVCEGPAPAPEICDGLDNNCNGQADEGFPDTDGDGLKDCLVSDKDGDGVVDGLDNCPSLPNSSQADADLDGMGDACDLDDDNDQVGDIEDCSPLDSTVFPGAEELCNGADDDCDFMTDEGFADSDADKLADCIDDDDDADGAPDAADCAPLNPALHPDATEECDGIDNDCDDLVDEGYPDSDADLVADCVDEDLDGDGVPNDEDNCPPVDNPGQEDQDLDGIGDACDGDGDGDSIPDGIDNCPGEQNTLQADTDGDGDGDACDDDMDGDQIPNVEDNCLLVANTGQEDADGDGVGDACEDDLDGDGVADAFDCAPAEPTIFPGAEELCDDADNDCDFLVDEGYPDTDNDLVKDCVDDDDDNDGDPDETDCLPADGAIHHLADELCDGIDNDCDDEVDELLGTLSCGKGECAHVTPACIQGQTQICDPLEGVALETCDGLDNDCDGLVDEDLGAMTCGLGVCLHTAFNCVGGSSKVCDPMLGSELEKCDGLDNDCDGQVDEEMPLLACGEGQCFHTAPSCVGGVVQECNPLAGALPEVCDGVDNDCDGDVDEELGTTTCGLGGCAHTVDNCSSGVAQICNPFEGATAEECNDADDDCDGVADDDLGTLSCGLGQCLHAVANCVGGLPQVCDPMEGSELEECDGLDNDCDGDVDEELGSVTCGLGICIHTVDNCVGGLPNICDPMEGFEPEECDGLDNDCDGTVDQGFTDTDSDGDADCLDDDDDGDGTPDDDDCQPLNPAVNPDMVEVCFNDVDDDCAPITPDQCVLSSCAQVLAVLPNAQDGTYTLDVDGDGPVDPFTGYCDMTTDGGGWLLISTQKPDGQLYQTAPISAVVFDKGINQKYSPAVLEALAALGGYQVMVEENSGADVSAGLVMVYLMPAGIQLKFDSTPVAVSTVEWLTGNNEYFTVNNNQGGSSGWWSLSVHSSAFNGLASNKRCVQKGDFLTSGGSNGDYKLDHTGVHSGTTRCVHSTTGIGVTHWLREVN